MSEKKPISWSVYHSQLQAEEANHNEPAIFALPPLFPDQTKSAATIRHSMEVFKDCVNRVKPGKTGSGWTSVLSEVNAASPGTADAFRKAAMVTCTRRAHQVTAGSL